MEAWVAYKRRAVWTVVMAISNETYKFLTADFASVAESVMDSENSLSQITNVYFFSCASINALLLYFTTPFFHLSWSGSNETLRYQSINIALDCLLGKPCPFCHLTPVPCTVCHYLGIRKCVSIRDGVDSYGVQHSKQQIIWRHSEDGHLTPARFHTSHNAMWKKILNWNLRFGTVAVGGAPHLFQNSPLFVKLKTLFDHSGHWE